VIAFVAGAATVLAFAPVGFYPLALATFGVLIHQWSAATPGRALRAGFAFGLGLSGAGVSWVYISMTQFGGMPSALAVVAMVSFCAFLALFPAAAGWLQARIPASDGVRACLLIPASWTLFEWSLTWVFTGFPWLAAGYAAAGWPVQGYAPLLGVYGASFVTLAAAGLVWLLATRRSRLASAVALLAIAGAGEALRHVNWTEPAGVPLPVALLQGNIKQEIKFVPGHYERIVETYARLAEETRAQLIVLPETALPRYLDAIEPATLARLEAAARRNDGDLLSGVPYRAGRDHYNSVLSLGTSPRHAYHKVHLVPFGEFTPPGFGWLMRTVEVPMSDFSRGAASQAPLAVAGQRVAVNICYEDAFGDEIARAARQATLLVNLSNVAWFGDSLAPAQHLQIARLRAVETGRMHLTATNTGITAAIDRDGRVLARLPQYAEGRLEISAQGYSGDTPYLLLRDWPVIAASLLILVAATLVARRRLSK
jgi:apolipoprotein N-acyltransferase